MTKNVTRSPVVSLQLTEATRMLDTRNTAEFLQLNERTLENWRSAGKGPRYLKIGGRVRYRVSDLLSYLDSSIRHSTGDRGPAAA